MSIVDTTLQLRAPHPVQAPVPAGVVALDARYLEALASWEELRRCVRAVFDPQASDAPDAWRRESTLLRVAPDDGPQWIFKQACGAVRERFLHEVVVPGAPLPDAGNGLESAVDNEFMQARGKDGWPGDLAFWRSRSPRWMWSRLCAKYDPAVCRLWAREQAARVLQRQFGLAPGAPITRQCGKVVLAFRIWVNRTYEGVHQLMAGAGDRVVQCADAFAIIAAQVPEPLAWAVALAAWLRAYERRGRVVSRRRTTLASGVEVIEYHEKLVLRLPEDAARDLQAFLTEYWSQAARTEAQQGERDGAA